MFNRVALIGTVNRIGIWCINIAMISTVPEPMFIISGDRILFTTIFTFWIVQSIDTWTSDTYSQSHSIPTLHLSPNDVVKYIMQNRNPKLDRILERTRTGSDTCTYRCSFAHKCEFNSLGLLWYSMLHHFVDTLSVSFFFAFYNSSTECSTPFELYTLTEYRDVERLFVH